MVTTTDKGAVSSNEPVQEIQGLAAQALLSIGTRIRQMRSARGFTLQALADMTGLSASLLSLVERGKTSPSIGTLVAVAHALGVHMADLVPGPTSGSEIPVTRAHEQPVYATPEGVNRRILCDDRVRGLEVALNEYTSGGRSADESLHHDGYEYGVVIEGVLTVDVDGEAYDLNPGDSIAYDSSRPHRIKNNDRQKARAIWVNLDRA